MKNYKNTILALFFLSVALFAKPKTTYDVLLYGKIDFCTITIEEKIIISPAKTGEMFFETLKYNKKDLNKDNLLLFFLSNTVTEIEDAKWKKDFTLIDNLPCQIRFLDAGDETINKIDATLYRVDIKLLEGKIDKKTDILNMVLLNNSVMKVWIGKESKNIIKISIKYKGLEYIVTHNA